jgi:uracil-DNA glycosylase family 4
MSFCHLHVHDEYSLLDGLGTAEQYCNKAKEQGFEYLAITNHGNNDGAIKFQKEAAKAGIKPVFGAELYIVEDVTVKEKGESRKHIAVFVRDEAGWANLNKMLTIAHLDGFYHRPRISPGILLDHLEGLSVSTACASSFISEPWGKDLLVGIKERCPKDIFLEIMPHVYDDQKKINALCLDLHEKFGIKLLATNDCHYVNAEDAHFHEILLAMQTKKKWTDKDRWKFSIKGLYLKSEDEMRESFEVQNSVPEKEYSEAMENSVWLAQRCSDFKIEQLDTNLPHIPRKPDNITAEDFLRELCYLGFEKKILATHRRDKRKEYRLRMQEEFDVIVGQGFSSYFLIVWELIDWCRSHDIMVGPGRGSSAGSLVCFLLGITSLDPIEHDLLFARFISPARIDLPDIDMDFEDIKRGEIWQHMKDVYGEANVAAVSTFASMKGRGALRDISRVFDIPLVDVNAASSCIVVRSGGDFRSDFTIEDAFATFEDGRKFKEKYPAVTKAAIRMEGQVKGKGQHAAAICVSKESLREGRRGYLSVGGKGDPVINWDKYDIEHVGLMKLDVLGLNALTILNCTRHLVRKNKDVDIDYEALPLDDDKIFQEFTAGHTVGIFQFGSLGLRKVCKEIGIDNFKILTDTNALFRPGTLRCVAGDTEIYCWSGKRVRIDEIDVGRPVKSSAVPILHSRKYIRNRVKEILETGEKDIWELVDSDGYKIKTSAEHKFFVKKKYHSNSGRNRGDEVFSAPCWVELKDISVGDFVLKVSREMSEAKILHTKKYADGGMKTRFKKGEKAWNKGKKKFTDYSYDPYSQKDHIKERCLEKWKSSLFSNQEKLACSINKMRDTKKKFWEDENNHKKQSNAMIEYYSNHDHPNSKGIVVSKPQREIYEAVKFIFLDAELEYRFDYIDFEGRNRFFSFDVAVPEQKVNIEFDGDYWHDLPGERIEPRDSIVEKSGWTIIRLTYQNYRSFIKNAVSLAEDNNTKYSRVASITAKGKQKTYDLVMENQGFPNYIANNFVVHNSGMVTEYQQRKRGEKEWHHRHPFLESITGDTYGVLLYQEQVMRFMYDLGGLGWKTADTVRKVMSKSQGVEQFMKFKDMFVEGCKKKETLDEKTAADIWDELSSFGSYGFNKSHAAVYSLIAYWEMYCKIYYPAEFFCASLTYGSDDKKEDLVEEAMRRNIDVRPPKVGISDAKFWVEKDEILYAPFVEIKGVGEKLAATMAALSAKKTIKRTSEGFFSIETGATPRVSGILQEIGAYEDVAITEEKAIYIDKYFDFSLCKDPLRKFRSVIDLISRSITFDLIESIDFGIVEPENGFYFGQMTQIKFGYRGKIDTIEKKLGASGLADNLGGVYGNFKDNTDFCMLVFDGNVYKKKKDMVEHSSEDFLIAKANHPNRTTSILCNDAWFSKDILECELDGLGLSLINRKRVDNGMLHGAEDCRNCELRLECRAPVLPSRGYYNLMVVGEAPGKEEDIEGRGFVGRSGDLVWDKLAGKGVSRQDIYVDNVCKCWPSTSKTPSKKQIKACSGWLDKEIRSVSPVLILAFGNSCMQFFKNEEKGIMDMSGTTEWNDKYKAWICWCVHPASVLYHTENMELFDKGINNFVNRINVLGGI